MQKREYDDMVDKFFDDNVRPEDAIIGVSEAKSLIKGKFFDLLTPNLK